MSVLASDYQNLIIASLSQAEPTATERLQVNVPKYWVLNARQPYNELRYLYTLRDAIHLCQACNTHAVNYARRTQNSTRTALSNGLQFSESSSQAQDDSVSLSDRNAIAQSDSQSDGTGSAESTNSQTSAQSMAQDVLHDDFGAGSNFNKQIQHQHTETTNESDVEQNSIAAQEQFRRRRRDNGAGTKENESSRYLEGRQGKTYSLLTDVDLGIDNFFPDLPSPYNFFPLGIKDLTTSSSTSTSESKSTEDTYTTTPNDFAADAPATVSYQDVTVRVMPYQKVDMEMYDVPVTAGSTFDAIAPDLNPASARKSQHQEFTAAVADTDSQVTVSSGSGASTGTSQNNSFGVSAGIATSVGNALSTQVANATRTAHSEGNNGQSSQAVSQTDSIMEKLHQRFLHLQVLWENTNDMIKHMEKQRLGSASAYQVRAILIQYPELVSANLALIANQYLVRQPGAF